MSHIRNENNQFQQTLKLSSQSLFQRKEMSATRTTPLKAMNRTASSDSLKLKPLTTTQTAKKSELNVQQNTR